MDAVQTGVNKTSSLGWIYVVVSDTRSAGPRQPVPSWLPGSAVAAYGSLLIVVGILLNAMVLVSSLGASGKGSMIPVFRRLQTVNLAVVQLAAAVLVIPAGVVTEAAGGWTFGGLACRAWLLAQVLLIAAMMWSLVSLDVDCVLRLVAPRRVYAMATERHPHLVALLVIISAWVVAGLASLPLGLAVCSRQAGADGGDNSAVLEDVCAVSLSRRDVIAQSVAAFHLPATLVLTGSVVIIATKAVIGVDRRGRGEWSTLGSVVMVGVASVMLWSPFFVLYTLLPFCGDALCIEPATWTLFAWVGHSTVVLAPAAWFIDPALRADVQHLLRRLCRRCCCGCYGNVTSSASSVSDVVVVGNVDESRGLMSVAKYQIQRPAQQQHIDSLTVNKLPA